MSSFLFHALVEKREKESRKKRKTGEKKAEENEGERKRIEVAELSFFDSSYFPPLLYGLQLFLSRPLLTVIRIEEKLDPRIQEGCMHLGG